jgi:hypothetical protein
MHGSMTEPELLFKFDDLRGVWHVSLQAAALSLAGKVPTGARL